MRRLLVVVVVSASLFTLAATGVAAVPGAPVAALQEEPVEADAPAPASRVFLLGEAYAGDGYVLTVHAVRSAPSLHRPGFTEVRAGVHLHNDGSDPVVLPEHGGFDPTGTAGLYVADDRGNEWPLDVLHPLEGALNGSDVIVVEPGLSARWTAGFQVPVDRVAASRIVYEIGGVAVAEWDLASASVGVEFASPEATTIALGTSFPWDEDLRATVTGYGSRVCGDPSIESVAHIVTVTVAVDNAASREYVWPGVRFPEVPATAQWADGSSGRMSLETHVGSDPGLFRYLGAAGSLLPPEQVVERAFVMVAPRDGRFVDLSAQPSGIWLRPPAAGDGAVWVDLAGVAPTVGIDAAMCDLGELSAPIPYAYAPSPKFAVLGEGPFPDPEAQDREATTLLLNALAAAGIWFDGHGLTFNAVTAADLTAVAPTISWTAHTAGSSLPATVGTVWFDRRVANRNEFYAITRSASGTWFCSLMDAYATTVSFSGPTATSTAALCIPALGGDDDES